MVYDANVTHFVSLRTHICFKDTFAIFTHERNFSVDGQNISLTRTNSHIFIYTCINTYTNIYIHTFVHTYRHASMYASIHAYTHSCIHTYLHACTHTYIYIHTYIIIIIIGIYIAPFPFIKCSKALHIVIV